MSYAIKQEAHTFVVVIEGEMMIQHAAEFYQAVLPLAGFPGAVRLDASAAKSIHTSIMQILYALSQAAPDFAVIEASAEFLTAENRVGISLSTRKLAQITDRRTERA